MSKTRKEIIDETAAEYTLVSRAVAGNNESCMYITPDGRKCAVGRCMIAPSDVWTCTVHGIPNLDGHLLEEYRGHPIEFWEQLQALHDGEKNWDAEGLSVHGQTYVETLHKKWDEVETCLT